MVITLITETVILHNRLVSLKVGHLKLFHVSNPMWEYQKGMLWIVVSLKSLRYTIQRIQRIFVLTAPSISRPFWISHCGSIPQIFCCPDSSLLPKCSIQTRLWRPQPLGAAETEQPQQNNLLLRAQLCANIQHAGPEGHGGEMCRGYLTWESDTNWNSEVEVLVTLM